MAASFPNSVKNFTVKIDGFDDVMAEHINSLQDEVMAIENYLRSVVMPALTDVMSLQDEVMAIENYLLGGWSAAVDAWEYVSATSFRVSGDKRTMFPVGTKIKLTQTGTTKYFYVTATSYASEYTTVTVTGGSDYSLDNQVITIAAYSYAATPQGFPNIFSYTPVAVGLTDPVYLEQLGKFVINGNTLSCWGRLDISSWSGQSGTLLWTMPVPISIIIGGSSIGSASYGADTQQGPKIIWPYAGNQVRMLSNTGWEAVQWPTSSRVLIIWSASYPI